MIWTVIGASVAVFSWKLLGYLVPRKFIGDSFRAFADRVTVVLLAALVGIQGLTSSGDIEFDARIPALGVAALLLWLRVPYILVILAAAITAAILRFLLGL